MNNNMLPSSASGFMRHTEKVTQRLTDLPVDLRQLWDPDECSTDLLPYLAWALSVDRWDKNWSEQTKRQVIKASWLVHRQKGTISALRHVVEPFGFLLRVIEWWQRDEEPGTFRLEIGTQEQGITEETYWEIERLIGEAKPASRHLIGLNISLSSSGSLFISASCYYGETLTIYPYIADEITIGGEFFPASAIHLIDSLNV
ncbi:phage tail protein I [Yersinia enterocolitica]|nr:phage tail protein I [Yersinia enterocolitica]